MSYSNWRLAPAARIGFLGLVLLCLASPLSGQEDAIIAGSVVSALGGIQTYMREHVPGESAWIDLTALSNTQAAQVAARIRYPRGTRDRVILCDDRRRNCHIDGADALIEIKEVSMLDGKAIVHIRMDWEPDPSSRIRSHTWMHSIVRVSLEQAGRGWVVTDIKETGAN